MVDIYERPCYPQLYGQGDPRNGSDFSDFYYENTYGGPVNGSGFSSSDYYFTEDDEFDPNCTEVVRNITLQARDLRMNPLYVVVRKYKVLCSFTPFYLWYNFFWKLIIQRISKMVSWNNRSTSFWYDQPIANTYIHIFFQSSGRVQKLYPCVGGVIINSNTFCMPPESSVC